MSAGHPHLAGRWKMIPTELDREPAPNLVAENNGMTCSAGTMEVPFYDQISISRTFRPTTNNGTITLLLESRRTLTNRQ
ncbi:MAG: hypothetical protein WEE89_05055 [Gemmatimonadota bacterium]